MAYNHISAETMKMQGYNVIAEKGWVIKLFSYGSKGMIKPLQKINRPLHIVFK